MREQAWGSGAASITETVSANAAMVRIGGCLRMRRPRTAEFTPLCLGGFLAALCGVSQLMRVWGRFCDSAVCRRRRASPAVRKAMQRVIEMTLGSCPEAVACAHDEAARRFGQPK